MQDNAIAFDCLRRSMVIGCKQVDRTGCRSALQQLPPDCHSALLHACICEMVVMTVSFKVKREEICASCECLRGETNITMKDDPKINHVCNRTPKNIDLSHRCLLVGELTVDAVENCAYNSSILSNCKLDVELAATASYGDSTSVSTSIPEDSLDEEPTCCVVLDERKTINRMRPYHLCCDLVIGCMHKWPCREQIVWLAPDEVENCRAAKADDRCEPKCLASLNGDPADAAYVADCYSRRAPARRPYDQTGRH